MSGCKCSFVKCERSKRLFPTMRQFKFPVTNEERCRQWIINSGNNDLFKLETHQLRRKFICEVHFKKEDFGPSGNHLKNTSVPTPYTPNMDMDSGDDSNEWEDLDDSSDDDIFGFWNNETDDSCCEDHEHNWWCDCDTSDEDEDRLIASYHLAKKTKIEPEDNKASSSETMNNKTKATSAVHQNEGPSTSKEFHYDEATKPMTPSTSQTKSKPFSISAWLNDTRISSMRRTLVGLALPKRLKSFNKWLQDERVPKFRRVLVGMQVREPGTPWTSDEKEFAIMFHQVDPIGYNNLQNDFFILPPASSVKKWIQESEKDDGQGNSTTKNVKLGSFLKKK